MAIEPVAVISRAEAAGGGLSSSRARVLAELGHGDAAQRQLGCVVAQGDMLEGAEGVAGGKSPHGGGDK